MKNKETNTPGYTRKGKPINRNRRVPNNRFIDQSKNILYSLRERLGMTQAELARVLATNIISIGLYEMGKQIPTAYTMKKYQKILAEHGLEISLDELFQHVDVTNSYSRFIPKIDSNWDDRDIAESMRDIEDSIN